MPCEKDPGGGGFYDCEARPACCSLFAACYKTYSEDSATCRKLPIGQAVCLIIVNQAYSRCLVDALASNACNGG